MNVEGALIEGLKSVPKYIPVWYRYDKQGSEYNDRCLDENKFYYFYSSEISVIKQHVKVSSISLSLSLSLSNTQHKYTRACACTYNTYTHTTSLRRLSVVKHLAADLAVPGSRTT